jgi:hypothetical protein
VNVVNLKGTRGLRVTTSATPFLRVARRSRALYRGVQPADECGDVHPQDFQHQL